ncbi:MAG: isocitrate lyase/phosphoenolpyruvate mutase family protein [Actinomycetota bacterium]|nr:isocitrate lyase/phosphoenolpyruvate mutase family protein [Actinomycetota bacterium]
MPAILEMTTRFGELHRSDMFVMPNAWDAGSAKLLESLGAVAIATTSSGFAASLGRPDMSVTRDEVVAHTAALAGAVDIPLSVDAERGYGATPDDVATTVAQLAGAGAAGCSIEDYDPAGDRIDPIDVATARVAAAVEAASAAGLVLTARAENHIHGVDDLDDTIERLTSYRRAGAHVLYAPGLLDADDIARVVDAMQQLGAPVNVLAAPGTPPITRLAELGVRRVSVGGMLAWVAYGALAAAASELLDEGTTGFTDRMLRARARNAAFGTR